MLVIALAVLVNIWRCTAGSASAWQAAICTCKEQLCRMLDARTCSAAAAAAALGCQLLCLQQQVNNLSAAAPAVKPSLMLLWLCTVGALFLPAAAALFTTATGTCDERALSTAAKST
jgi:hypothetical protein